MKNLKILIKIVSIAEKIYLAPIPKLKLDLGFGSLYQNLASVADYDPFVCFLFHSKIIIENKSVYLEFSYHRNCISFFLFCWF